MSECRRQPHARDASGKKTAVFGIYSSLPSADNATDTFVRSGFPAADISALLPDNLGGKEIGTQKATKAPEGAATGAGSGAVLGGALGLLAGIGALAIPGVGPFIAAGPIMAALAGVGVGGAVGEALHPEREPLETLNHIREALGEYNFAGQYQQSPAPLGGGFVKAEWFKTYTATPEKFEMILQSWDSANKASELSDFSVCTTWGVKEKHIYLLHVFRKRLDYPDLKRAVKEQAQAFGPQTILIEDKASGTQLIQELVAEGMHAIQKYEPSMNKVVRMNTVTSMIECGFVHVPDKAAYLAEYLHELANFPNGKHDDQADSTSQALDWFKQRYVIVNDPYIIVPKYEHWTELPGEFPGSGSSALFRDSGRTRMPSFARS